MVSGHAWLAGRPARGIESEMLIPHIFDEH